MRACRVRVGSDQPGCPEEWAHTEGEGWGWRQGLEPCGHSRELGQEEDPGPRGVSSEGGPSACQAPAAVAC